MSRFVSKVLLFILPILLFVFVVEYIARQIPNNYSYKNEYLNENAENIEILVLGSSLSYFCINPIFFSRNAFNASNVSQTLKYDYFIFNKFKLNLSNLKVLILPISYPTLFSQLEDGKEEWRIKNYSIYCGCNYHNSPKYRLEILNKGQRGLLKNVVKYLWLKEEFTNVTVSNLGFGLSSTDFKQGDLIVTGKTAAKRHTKEKFNRLDSNIEILNQLISECSKMNVRVFLFTPPAWSTYLENLNMQQFNVMNTSILNIVKLHTNAEYHSFMQDERFVKEDFRNADHLSGVGAEKLTKIIDQMIKDLEN